MGNFFKSYNERESEVGRGVGRGKLLLESNKWYITFVNTNKEISEKIKWTKRVQKMSDFQQSINGMEKKRMKYVEFMNNLIGCSHIC